MDATDHPLVGSWLNFGQFSVFNPRLSSRGKVLNRLIRLIVFFNAVKVALIALAAWFGYLDLRLWLIEMFLFDEQYQKFIDVAILMLQMGIHLGYDYWVGLSEKSAALKSFRFLVVPDDPRARSRYGRLYDLDQQSTNKFLAIYRLACTMQRLIVAVYSIFVAAVITRCLYHSFYAVSFAYFLSAGLLLWVVTIVAYLFLVVFAISVFVLVLLSTEFFIYRLRSTNTWLSKSFATADSIRQSSKRLKKQQRAALIKVLCFLGEFCQHFEEINCFLDCSISTFLVGLYCNLFVIPFFLLFVENELSIRLFFSLTCTVSYTFCFSFTICNDRLQRQVGPLLKFKILKFLSLLELNLLFMFFPPSRSKRWRTQYTTFSHFSLRQPPKSRSTTSFRWTANIRTAFRWAFSGLHTTPSPCWRYALNTFILWRCPKFNRRNSTDWLKVIDLWLDLLTGFSFSIRSSRSACCCFSTRQTNFKVNKPWRQSSRWSSWGKIKLELDLLSLK